MRYAIFSDVHSNLEAFEVVTNFLSSNKVDAVIFLGDIVGYGANPNQVIDLLRSLNATCIAGNHDWAAVNKFDPRYFNSFAREAIKWTKKQLTSENKTFLNRIALGVHQEGFECVHGDLDYPEEFNYILSVRDAYKNFKLMRENILFVGHSHRQETYILYDDKVIYDREVKFKIEDDRRYIINVGSVGQPRDGDNRACVCIYEDDAGMVSLHRLEYDIKKAADKILREGLPGILSRRLYVGQ